MTVYRRGKNWEAQVYVKGKRAYFKGGFTSKRAAEKWQNLTLHRIMLVEGDEAIVKAATFDDLIALYCEIHLPTIRTGTATRYMIDINQRILPFFQFYKLYNINQFLIEEFKTKIIHELSQKSVNNCFALLKSIFKKAKERNLIAVNPAERVPLQRLTTRKYVWWEKEEDIRKFLEVARHDRFYLAYRLALDLGMRLGEIVGLTAQDIKLPLGQIHIHRQWLEKERKYGATKHGKDRYLKYPEGSELALLIEQAVSGKNDEDPLFITVMGNLVSCRKLSGYYFQQLIVKADVPRIRFHDLRHTFASWYMMKNDDIWELMRILGHADIQTTQKYAHLSSIHKSIPSFDW